MRGTAFGLAVAMLAAGPAQADTYYQWYQGQPWVDMGDTGTNFCFLQSVQGRFSGNGERVRLYDTGGRWRLYGSSGTNSVAGSARCAPRSEFGKEGDTRIASSDFTAEKKKDGSSSCFSVTKQTWWGDAWTAISSIGGRLRGGGEYIQVNQSTGGKMPSVVEAHTCQDDPQIAGAAVSYFVGKPQSGKLARFFGPKLPLTPATAPFAGEYAVGANQSVLMAPVGKSYCFFTAIGGNFQGESERVEIIVGADATKNPAWLLRTFSKSSGGVFARARCLAKAG